MSDTLQATISPHISAFFQNAFTADGQNLTSRAKAQLDMRPNFDFSDGTSANQADKVYKLTGQVISSGGTLDIDVYDLGSLDAGLGAGRDNLGQTVALAEVCAILIVNRSTSAGSLLIGGKNATTAFNSFLAVSGSASDTAQVGPIPPDGFFMIGSRSNPAFAVADTSNHILTLTASGGACTVDIQIIGRSA